MAPPPSASPFAPVMRALAQLDDPVFLGVLVRCVAWSVVCFVALYAGAIATAHWLLNLHGWLAWMADLLGSIGAALLAFWLFLPVAAAIGTLYFDRIAFAVERRYYPWLPPPHAAPLLEQVWDGLAVALRVLAMNIVALVLALLIPGVGLVLGWMVAAYAIGRGLFVAVAMRRMPRESAESLYQARRWSVLLTGGVLALAAYVPLANLLIPVVGVAAMVHVLDAAMAAAPMPRSAPPRPV
ncbi:EI24 domain-containing protein [Rhodopila sp.]|uniref:EI24 domain-containing protein n=1 Tax=Rhodopila sp. TaxID=2480087 RepID=UPI002C79708D|nr:EI24 domain-containing protein [Rhodopila sp.]HVZ07136.1 EI24 domain-containing protein [Rhodopila sp.]